MKQKADESFYEAVRKLDTLIDQLYKLQIVSKSNYQYFYHFLLIQKHVRSYMKRINSYNKELIYQRKFECQTLSKQ